MSLDVDCMKFQLKDNYAYCKLKCERIISCKDCNYENVELSKCCRCKSNHYTRRDVLFTKNGKICFICLRKDDLKPNGYWMSLLFPERKNKSKNKSKRGKK